MDRFMLPVAVDQTTGQEVSQPPSVLARFPSSSCSSLGLYIILVFLFCSCLFVSLSERPHLSLSLTNYNINLMSDLPVSFVHRLYLY